MPIQVQNQMVGRVFSVLTKWGGSCLGCLAGGNVFLHLPSLKSMIGKIKEAVVQISKLSAKGVFRSKNLRQFG